MVASQTGSQGMNWWSMAALSTAAIAPLVIIGIFLERYIVSGAGGLTVAVNAKTLTGRVILLYHGLELRKLSWIARTIAHAQGRHGSIGIGRLPRETTESAKRDQRAYRLLPSTQNALLNRLDFDHHFRPARYVRN
jgi:hypothetical protein